MTITGALVLFAVIWFITLLLVLPYKMTTQQKAGHVVAGTPSSAPDEIDMRRKIKITTMITILLWAISCGVVLSGWVSLADLNYLNFPSDALARD